MLLISKYFLWFIIYSLLGWFYESALCSITEKKFVNRGFLNSPLCPIYGIGAISIIIILGELSNNIILLFLISAILSCSLEYISSFILEKIFATRWWDYSNHRLNIHGRVCFLGACVFGLLSVLCIRYVHPFIIALTSILPDYAIIYTDLIFLIVILSDLYLTSQHIFTLNGTLSEIQGLINQYINYPKKHLEVIKSSLYDKFEISEYYSEKVKEFIKSYSFQTKRLLKAFPKMKSIKYEEALQKIKNKFML